MGSATREALATSRAALSAAGATTDLATGEGLFGAGRVIGSSSQLLSALGDAAADAAAKVSLVRAVFGANVTPRALELLAAVVSERWSSHDDLLAGIEDLGLRACALSAPAETSIENELFAFGTTVSSDAGLELALASRMRDGVLEELLAQGVPCAPVLRGYEAFESEWLWENDVFEVWRHPRLGDMLGVRAYADFARGASGFQRPTPDLGQHSGDLLEEMGYSPARIAELLAAGAIFGPAANLAHLRDGGTALFTQ